MGLQNGFREGSGLVDFGHDLLGGFGHGVGSDDRQAGFGHGRADTLPVAVSLGNIDLR